MADPKFANLPGIAYDQADLYETSDLPEADQANIEADQLEDTDGIEKLNLNAKASYEKFKGKSLNTSNTDFSDRIGRQRRIGYESVSGKYGTVDSEGAAKLETPEQKFLRLQEEVQSLKDDLENSKSKHSNAEDLDVTKLISDAGRLEQLLRDMKLEEMWDTIPAKNRSDPRNAELNKLMAKLEAYKQTKSNKSSKQFETAEGESKTGEVLYELHYHPESTKFDQYAKLGELERRLQVLETAIGKDVERAVTLASDTNNRSVLAAVATLNSKMNLLEPTHIDQVDAHLTALSLRLTQLTDKKAQLEDADKISKISETYQLLKKAEALCVQLPDVVNRMVSIKELHEQALQFSTALSQLDASQGNINAGIKNNQEVLSKIQEEFAKNIDVMKANIKSIDERIANLTK